MRTLGLALCLLLSLAAAHAVPTATAAKLDAAPTLDGQLTEACWQGPALLRDFVLTSGGQPQAKTEAWVAYDAEALYVAVKAYEPRLAELKATVTDRNSTRLFGDDVIEVFVDPARDKFHFLQFAVNPLGTRFDLQGDAAGSSPDWTGVWQAAGSRGEGCWTVEMRLPFATLGVSRLTGQTWGFNLARERQPQAELSSWVRASGKFATPQSFGELVVGADLAPFRYDLAVTKWGGGLIGTNQITGTVTNLTRQPASLKVAAVALPAGGAAAPAQTATVNIKPGGTTPFVVNYAIARPGQHFLELAASAAGRPVASVGHNLLAAELAEFSIFNNFYRDDVTVRYLLNVAPAERAKYHLSLALRAEGKPEVLARQTVAALKAATGDVAVPTGKLPRGRYEIDAAIQDASGKALLARTLKFAELRDQGVTKRAVSLRAADGMLLVAGKPFFPLGIYEGAATTEYLKSLRQAGFNVCLNHGISANSAQKLLDRVQAAGMHLWIPVSSTMDFSKDAERKREELRKLVAAAGSHPALLCWESIDEPAWGDQSADGLYEGYCFLRALDQQRPIWTNHAPRNTIATLAHFNRATDISGADIYPVPEGIGHSNLPVRGLPVVGAETAKNLAALGNRPVFMVLQGFGWGELSKVKAVMPTFEESRFMAYDSIVYGATGILYWGTHYTAKPARFWSELRSLVSELAGLHDVLAALPVKGAAQARLAKAAPGVKLLHKQWQGRQFVFVVNENATAVKAQLAVPGLKATKLKRLYEGQTLDRGRGAAWTVPLAKYGVAVLTDDLGFRDVRQDFSAEWQNAPAQPAEVPGLLVPGNLIRNPGFEVDANADGMPDEWAAQTSLTSELVESDKHEGKVALAITGEGPDAASLLVQRGLGVKGGQKYRLSAWVRSASPDAEFRIYVEWVLGDKWLGKVLPWTKGNGEWQQVSVEFEATPDPQGGAYTVVQARGAGTVYFDDVRVEEIP